MNLCVACAWRYAWVNKEHCWVRNVHALVSTEIREAVNLSFQAGGRCFLDLGRGGSTVVQWLVLVASQEEGPGLMSRLAAGPGAAASSHDPKDMQVKSNGRSKLPVSVNGCLSLYVNPVMNGRLVRRRLGSAPSPPRLCKADGCFW